MKSLFVVLAMALPLISMGQELKVAPVIGVGGGMVFHSATVRESFSDLESLLDAKLKNRPAVGFTGGAWVDYAFSEKLGFRSGLMLSAKGGDLKLKIKQDDETGSGAVKQRYMYLELPLMLSFKLGETNMRFLIGPSFNLALSGAMNSSYRYESGGSVQKESESETMKIGTDPDKHYVKPLDVSVNIGVTKAIEVADRPMEFSLIASPSITKFTTHTKSEPDYFSRQFLVGLRLAYFFTVNN